MAHFAKVVSGIVHDVIVAEPKFFETFVDSSPGRWIQTSYNTKGGIHYGADGEPDGGIALRKNYASVGYSYDSTRDAFIPPKPYESWKLNEDTCLWDPPTPMPEDAGTGEPPKLYTWNESTLSWDEIIT